VNAELWRAIHLRRWAAYVLAALAVLLLRWPTLTNRILSIDEPTYFAQAALLRSFQEFIYAFNYRVETKTQIGLIPFLLANALDPRNAILLLHLFGMIAVLLSCWLLVALADRFLGRPWLGLAATLIWVPYLNIGPAYDPGGLDVLSEFPATLLEYFQTPFILLSLYGFLWATTTAGASARRAGWVLAGSGFAWAIAVLIKPSAALLALLYLLALIVYAAREGTLAKQIRVLLARGGAFAVGAALPVFLVFLPYLFNPVALAELRFNLVVVNGSYTTGSSLLVRALTLLIGLPPLLLLAFLLIPVLQRRHAPGAPPPALPLILWAGPILFLGILPGAGFLHYLIPVVPVMALAVVAYIGLLAQGWIRAGHAQRALVFCVLLAVVYWVPQLPRLARFPARMAADWYLNDDRARFDLDHLLAYIQTHTDPASTLWVYYNSPEVYLLAGRGPATRDPGGAYLSMYWTDPWFARTAAELAAAPPEMLIGIDHPRYFHPNALSLTEIPQVREIIARAYTCDSTLVRGAVICQRQDGFLQGNPDIAAPAR
jgi:hypothetical protein